MRSIRRRDTGESYREMLRRMARDGGIETPTVAELQQFDRTRKGKRTSNAEWASATDPEARITRMKDGRIHLAYKPEHAVDLDTGAVEVHPADERDTTTLKGTLEVAAEGPGGSGRGAGCRRPTDLVVDKGYHSRAVLKDLDGGPWRRERRRAMP